MSNKLLLPILTCLLLLGQASQLHAQPETPIIMDQPTAWGYERIDFPLGFAQEIPFEGFEELRFAPGWSKRDSPNYFTYAFAASITNRGKVKQKEIIQFLNDYYKGLSAAVAGGKDFKVDVSKITVELQKQGKDRYHAEVLFFDSFNKGEAVELHMEMKIYPNKKAGTATLLTLVSSKDKSDPIWEELHEIRTHVEEQLTR